MSRIGGKGGGVEGRLGCGGFLLNIKRREVPEEGV